MATLTDQLTEARAAYHKLMTGGAVRVFVDQNGERVEYVQADADKLAAYIERLAKLLEPCTVTGPLRVWF